MSVRMPVAEFPKHPVPHVPPPQGPQQPRVQPPTVFVYEQQRWEYRVVSRSVGDEPIVIEDELNALGRDGWELVGVVALHRDVQFYFKRLRG
jgi:Domain of unknown function (DUF4177)